MQLVNMSRKNEKWTSDEEKRLLDLRKDGLSWGQISRVIGRTESSCNVRGGALLQKGWSAEDDKNLLEFRAGGLTLREIAKLLKKSYTATYVRLNALEGKKFAPKPTRNEKRKRNCPSYKAKYLELKAQLKEQKKIEKNIPVKAPWYSRLVGMFL